MTAITSAPVRKQRGLSDIPYHVAHETFSQEGAEHLFNPRSMDKHQFSASHMPDELTRECARFMHYAAWRMAKAKDVKSRNSWHRKYIAWRDHIVLGNRKLVYRAIRRWSPTTYYAEDMTSDCHIVLIQSVAAYNPWLGIRFSTYAFTCLMRALSRMSQKQANDRLSRSLPLETLPDGEPKDASTEEIAGPGLQRIDEFLKEGNDLLSTREKMVIIRRFCLDEKAKAGTLAQVGRELGLSKERVRQVQASALEKLRRVLLEGRVSSN